MKEIKHGKTKEIKVCDLVPYEKNYVIHSEEQIEKIKRSIEEFGYRQKIGIGSDNIIVYGHSRWSALMQINKDMTIEVDDCSDLPEDKQKRLRVIDNSLKSNDIDDKKLHAELKEIFPNLQDNITNIQETMNIDISHIAKKMDQELAAKEIKEDNPKADPRPSRAASTKLAKIILEYTREDYVKVKELCAEASNYYGVTSTSDLFLKMLEDKK